MPKPIFNTEQRVLQKYDLSKKTSNNTMIDSLTLEKRLREKRSNEYMAIMKQLDISGCHVDQKKYNEFVSAIINEFPDIEFEDKLLGIVAKCYLGQPYEVHTLDLSGNIVVHYKKHENMPGMLNKARSLALHGGYDFIEVYNDCLRAVKSDGTVTVAK